MSDTTTATASHGTGHPSDWLLRWQHLLAPGSTALDVACGAGRHARWLAAQGLNVTAIDRDSRALAGLSGVDSVTTWCADLEAGDWPLPGRQFDLVLVTNYLWRPLFGTLIDAVAPGGLLIYETFALGQETVGRPSRAEFLLAPGELLTLTQPGLQVLGYEDGWSADDPLRRLQRACARKPAPAAPDATAGDRSHRWPQHLRLPAFSRP
jgi:SAM-dependent methyltransferase